MILLWFKILSFFFDLTGTVKNYPIPVDFDTATDIPKVSYRYFS